jgi:hypothetical protein
MDVKCAVPLKINDAEARSEQLMRCKIVSLVKGKLQGEKVKWGWSWYFSQLFALLVENFKGSPETFGKYWKCKSL